MFKIKPDGTKNITLTDLLICGVLGAAWLPLGIVAAAGIGGYKYFQSKTEKLTGEYPEDRRDVVKKFKAQ